MPRQLLFSVRMPESSVSITASSVSAISASTVSAAAALARKTTASASGSLRQQSATTRTSVMGRAEWGIMQSIFDPKSRIGRARGARAVASALRRVFVGGDNPRHQLMPNDVFGGKPHLRDSVDAVEQSRGFREPGHLAVR